MRKPFLDIHIRNVISKFESSILNGVAVIAKTYTHTYIPTSLKKNSWRLKMEKLSQIEKTYFK